MGVFFIMQSERQILNHLLVQQERNDTTYVKLRTV